MFGERAVVTKERLNGTYRLSAYWLAKMTAELPLPCLMMAGIWTLVYFMVGFPLDVKLYFSGVFITMLGTVMTLVSAVYFWFVVLSIFLPPQRQPHTKRERFRYLQRQTLVWYSTKLHLCIWCHAVGCLTRLAHIFMGATPHIESRSFSRPFKYVVCGNLRH